MSDSATTVVVGAGAAGLMAAIWAARAGQKVVVLESTAQAGKKILISGGGRCNLLPSVIDVNDYYSNSSDNVIKRLFRTWPLEQVQMFFEYEVDVPLQLEDETGKLFPSAQKAIVVRDALQNELLNLGGEIRFNHKVTDVKKVGNEFILACGDNVVNATKLVLATGGKSVPNTGSDGFGYEIARRMGHSNLPNYPALVPLATNEGLLTDLSGISLRVEWRTVKNDKTLEVGVNDLLFTHHGFSGPAILDASHWVVRDKADLIINFTQLSAEEWRQRFIDEPAKTANGILSDIVPARLAKALLEKAGVKHDDRVGNLPAEKRKVFIEVISNYKLDITGNRGLAVAEVTGGGVPLDEVNLSTLESKKTPGLYLCGEILDVIGRIGGYNFYWAFVSARLAGESTK
ncbi:MAG: aminoacetone oxidase family FAD-binding enzyme [Planctomycetes bacterium]|nr:aminoacetone oxidase family FAD-binding enzyme [Planctomycetota bacterium]